MSDTASIIAAACALEACQ